MTLAKGPAELARPTVLLVIVAHPTDADVAIGGSVARWVADGTVAHLVCATSGDSGATDAAADPLELAARREAEQRSAAAIIGYQDVTFLHRPDGALANDLALREQLVRIIRTVRPDVVASGDPRVIIGRDGSIGTADQRHGAAAALDAVYPAARNAMAFPELVRSEGLQPHAVTAMYFFATDQPDAWVDVSSTIGIKLGAVHEHRSQEHRLARLAEDVRARARHAGEAIAVEAAEAFGVIELP